MDSTLETPSIDSRNFLARASKLYNQQLLSGAEEDALSYLMETRQIQKDSINYFLLGVVSDPLPGHEMYSGRISIPYLAPFGYPPIAMKFRTKTDGMLEGSTPTGAKYMSDGKMRIYNMKAFHEPVDYIAICEGEIDTITAHQCGINAIGIPGVNNWKKRYRWAFQPYVRVLILTDNDDRGQGLEFAESVKSDVNQARIVLMPDGHDVNSFYREEGMQSLRKRIGLDK